MGISFLLYLFVDTRASLGPCHFFPLVERANRLVRYASGGGFSNIFLVHSYQHGAADDYLNRHDPGYKYYRGNASLVTTDG